MMECECGNVGLNNCIVIGIILALIIGVGAGIVYFLGLIPMTLNFIIVALILSVVALGILLGTLITANIIEGYNSFRKCVYKFSRFVLVGSIGTLLATTIAVTVGVVEISIISTILVAISSFFFILLIVALICLLSCIIKYTGREEWNA